MIVLSNAKDGYIGSNAATWEAARAAGTVVVHPALSWGPNAFGTVSSTTIFRSFLYFSLVGVALVAQEIVLKIRSHPSKESNGAFYVVEGLQGDPLTLADWTNWGTTILGTGAFADINETIRVDLNAAGIALFNAKRGMSLRLALIHEKDFNNTPIITAISTEMFYGSDAFDTRKPALLVTAAGRQTIPIA